ncbi:hypothetical protein GALL_314180 [mine drainage metagenome]|jgi:McbB family protein|uniref:McbB family protein n=1 Tax=mine drainage metagenome TaxID=410659 RepID=A0A1J5QTS9_9ZZZZ
MSAMLIERFELGTTSAGVTLLYSRGGAFRIDDGRVADVLRQLNELECSVIERRELFSRLDVFGSARSEVFDYICDVLRVARKLPESVATLKFALFADRVSNLRHVKMELSRYRETTLLCLDEGCTPEAAASLVVCFLENYREDMVRKIYAMGDKNIYLTAYLVEQTLYIDAPFRPSEGTPCHFCHMGRLKKIHAARAAGVERSWFYYSAYILKERVLMRNAMVPSPAQWGLIEYHIAAAALCAAGIHPLPANEMSEMMLSVDLTTGECERSPIVHWEFCDCYA